MSTPSSAVSRLAYPCRSCGKMPVAGKTVHGRKTLHIVECRNRACPVQAAAVAETEEEALARWNGANRAERPIF